MGGADGHLAVARWSAARAARSHDAELAGAAQVERRRAVLGEELEAERVRQAEGDPGGGQGAGGARGERRGERDDVLVLDRLADVAESRPRACPTAAPSGSGALGDDGREHGTADGLDRPAEELGEVDEVAADVGQRARAGTALVAPAHRRRRVDAVVAPVVAVEVHRPARSRRLDQAAGRGDGRRAAEREPDARLRGPVASGRRPPSPRRPRRSGRTASRTARACRRRAGPRRSRGAGGWPPRR